MRLNQRQLLPLLVLLAACQRREPAPVSIDGGHGKQLIMQYGCTSCHNIPGIEGPKGMVGPSLEHVAGRPMLAGSIPNTPENMAQYIQSPQSANPGNSMPNLGVKPGEARAIAAYLSTLK